MSSPIPTRCTRAVVDAFGGPDALRLENAPLPPLGPKDALVGQRALGLNFIDTYHRSGLYPLPSLPHGLGVEAAGEVLAVGREESLFRPGDRVAYATAGPGAYASHRVVPAAQLVPIPRGVSYEDAAAVLLKGMTVEYLVQRAYPVQPGETVLWHAAAGGVGLLACQWLSALGARVIGTVGSSDKAALARANGCAHAINYESADFALELRELTGGQGVGVVYDCVGRATFAKSLNCLRPRGLLVCFGNASGPPEALDLLSLARLGSLYVTRPTLAHYTGTREDLVASASAVFERVASGSLRPNVGQRFPLSEVASAHRALEGRVTVGASVLIPD